MHLIVALSRGQRQPPFQGIARCTPFARAFLRLNLRHRGHLFYVLYKLESLQDPARAIGDQYCGIPKRLEGAHGSAGEATGGTEMS